MSKRYLTTEQRRSALKLVYGDRNDKLCKDGVINFDDNGNVFFKTKEELQKIKEARQGFHQITFDEYLQEKEK